MKSKFATIVLLILAVPALFLALNIIHFRFFPVRVVLYDSLFDLLIAVPLVAGVCLWRRRGMAGDVTAYEVGLAGAVGVLLCILYAVMVPTVIDRSLSIYILEKIDQRGGGIRQDAFADVFISEYLPEFKLVDVRLTEQVNSGTVEIKNGCVLLTARGRLVTRVSSFYHAWLLPRSRGLMGKYSDVLINPFKESRKDVAYRCDGDVK